MNGDGHLDVIEGETGVHGGFGGVGIYLGTGTGSVNPPQVLANVHSAYDLALADMDGDLAVPDSERAREYRRLHGRVDHVQRRS